VTTYIHLVFSDPPRGVSEADYNTWYDAHLQEILSVDGWESATRYTIDAVVTNDGDPSYRYLSLYELTCPPEVAIANLEAAGMGSADSYVEKKDADAKNAPGGKLPLPDWFSGVRFGSWNCRQVSERVTLHGATT
jgi:hypothetical protein